MASSTTTPRHFPPIYPLGAVEAEFARQAMSHCGAQRVFLGVRLSGDSGIVGLVQRELPRALALAQIVHPMLRCVLVSTSNGQLVLQESNLTIDVARLVCDPFILFCSSWGMHTTCSVYAHPYVLKNNEA